MKTRLLSIFITAGLALALAWTVAAGTSARVSGKMQESGPVLRLNLGSTDPVIDPALTFETIDPLPAFNPGMFIDYQLFMGLVRADDLTGAPLPDLATGWTSSPDATVFTFTLRSGLTWTDGNPLTAYDARYGILRSLDPATPTNYPDPLFWIKNAEEYRNGLITDPDQVGITVLDYYHIQFTLKQPAGFFPSILTLPVARPVPAWAIAAHPTDWTEPANIVTNGAYKLKVWAHGSSMTLEKNPSYYQAANVQIGQVVFSMLDDASAWDLYKAGQLDSALVPPEQWSAASHDPTLAGQLHVAFTAGTNYFGFNTSKAPFDNPLVRKAFVASVNRQGLVDSLFQDADQPALTFCPPGNWGHVDGVAEGVGIPYDPAQARLWLAAAGYPNGQGLPPVTMMVSPRPGLVERNQAIAETLRQGWLNELGVNVTLSYIDDWGTYLNLLNTDPPQIWQLRWGIDYPDAYSFLGDSIAGFPSVKYGGWNNPTYNGLLNLAAQTSDPGTRALLYKQAEQILVETDAVTVPLYYEANGVAARSSLKRTYSWGGFGGRIADWRTNWPLFLPLIQR